MNDPEPRLESPEWDFSHWAGCDGHWCTCPEIERRERATFADNLRKYNMENF